MKRLTEVLTAALLAVLMMMAAGCSKEEDKKEMAKFTIDMEQVSILVGDDYTITPSEAFTARSTDEDVVTVNAAGVIHGVSAGDTDVIFTAADGGQTQTCRVNVDWKYKYFEEPILDLSLTLGQIKAAETHSMIRESEGSVTYLYNNYGITMEVSYQDSPTLGRNVRATFEPTDENFSLAKKQIEERFPQRDGNENYRTFKTYGVSRLYALVHEYKDGNSGENFGIILFRGIFFI